MDINKENIDYIELISSYLSDELSSSQISILEDWVKEDSDNKKTFLAYKNAWVGSNISKSNKNIDVNTEFGNLQSKLFVGNETHTIVKKNNSMKFLLRIAAVIAIILAGIVSVNSYLNNKTLIYTAQNEVIEQTTPDGSVISINRNSTVEFNNNSNKIRNVKLNGSAFFKVKHDDKVPFVIQTQDIKVSVLGTSFLVDSRPNDNFITIVVKSGKVSVKDAENEIILVAGEKGIFSKKENKLFKLKNNDVNYLSWKTKELEFNNSDLNEVVRVLKGTYNKNIIIDQSVDITNNKLTAKFNNRSFESVLNIIKETLDIKVEKGKNEIIIFSNN